MVRNKQQLIIINGTSCAGKSSIALYLKGKLYQDFVHVTWDSFVESLPADQTATDEDTPDLVALFVKKSCEQLDGGQNLILDIVCVPTITFQRLLDSFNKYVPLTVRIRASADILRDREMKRDDRENGQAEKQHSQMYDEEQHPEYDVEIDSTDLTIEQVGQVIIKKLDLVVL